MVMLYYSLCMCHGNLEMEWWISRADIINNKPTISLSLKLTDSVKSAVKELNKFV